MSLLLEDARATHLNGEIAAIFKAFAGGCEQSPPWMQDDQPMGSQTENKQPYFDTEYPQKAQSRRSQCCDQQVLVEHTLHIEVLHHESRLQWLL